MVCSSAVRTVETLRLIRPALPSSTSVTIDEALYGADVDELLDRVRRLPSTAAGVLLIGHNPGIGDLAEMLAGHGDRAARASIAAKFPTAALAILTIDGEWTAVAPGAASLEEYWTPP